MPIPPESNVLYEERFSGSTEWYQGETDQRRIWVENGAYQFHAIASDIFFYSVRSLIGPFTNFQFDIDTQQIAGPDDNGYGVVFRQSESGYYRYRISGDGWARFDKRVNGNYVAIRGWERTDLIQQGNATNHITVVANGSEFSFYVNGTFLWSASDTQFASGTIGVGVICLDDAGGTRVAFDNILLQALE
jgi:hypothetical protein